MYERTLDVDAGRKQAVVTTVETSWVMPGRCLFLAQRQPIRALGIHGRYSALQVCVYASTRIHDAAEETGACCVCPHVS